MSASWPPWLYCQAFHIIHGDLQKGQKVFINGCTGGVGSFAVQIAKAIGVEITGTCSKKNIGFANQMGVNHVIDYNKSLLIMYPQHLILFLILLAN
ncbi:zinc-binding dehydrogenase [Methanococcoides sp. SA1]|nr:zinc-binding dehydrogenase [Methanococcoides sp. SA1]